MQKKTPRTIIHEKWMHYVAAIQCKETSEQKGTWFVPSHNSMNSRHANEKKCNLIAKNYSNKRVDKNCHRGPSQNTNIELALQQHTHTHTSKYISVLYMSAWKF